MEPFENFTVKLGNNGQLKKKQNKVTGIIVEDMNFSGIERLGYPRKRYEKQCLAEKFFFSLSFLQQQQQSIYPKT